MLSLYKNSKSILDGAFKCGAFKCGAFNFSTIKTLIQRYFSLPKLSVELYFSLLFFICSLYFTVMCQKYSSNKRNNNSPLPDILHTRRLNYSKYYKLTDIPINIYVFLLIFSFNRHVPKFLWMMSITYFVRALSFSMTTLPKCGMMVDKDNNRSCSKILLDYVSLKDTHMGHNNDLLPSGHVCFSALFVMYANRYGYLSPLHNKILWSVNILNSIFIILTRCHYSIDVMYAYVISYLVYSKMNILI